MGTERISKCHKAYTSIISYQKLYPKGMIETTKKDTSFQYIFLNLKWPDTSLPSYITLMYCCYLKFTRIYFNLATYLIRKRQHQENLPNNYNILRERCLWCLWHLEYLTATESRTPATPMDFYNIQQHQRKKKYLQGLHVSLPLPLISIVISAVLSL